jgi:hypothetical protein
MALDCEHYGRHETRLRRLISQASKGVLFGHNHTTSDNTSKAHYDLSLEVEL